MESDQPPKSYGQADLPANVISLEEFRASVGRSEEIRFSEDPNPYKPADYLTFHAAKRTLEMLSDSETPGLFVVISRFVGDEPTTVQAARDPDFGWVYSLDKSVKDFESLTLDLETYTDLAANRLGRKMDRLFTSTLIAHYVLRRELQAAHDTHISLPKVGEEKFRPNNKEQTERITEWRAASAIGILALGDQRYSLPKQISEYLGVVLARRVEYTRNIEFVEALFNHSLDEDVDISDLLIGICNPLNPFELKMVVPSVKLK